LNLFGIPVGENCGSSFRKLDAEERRLESIFGN
jgi:hypothetical protein